MIKNIEIRGLFQKYQLKWDLNQDVNILVGINGAGKTTILKYINAILSKQIQFLKKMDLTIEITDFNNVVWQYVSAANNLITKNAANQSNKIVCQHDFITTFDVPLKDKRIVNKLETPLDKELQRIIYTVGKEQKSFSNYRFKATNFPEQAEKINSSIKNLFSLINDLLKETNKTIDIKTDDNSLIFRIDKSFIPLEKLSSGEKQMLIILFTVFLMEEAPGVLLMDEPEISLHISWQQKLIDVIRILNPNCQLIIATHSPSIFGKGWGDKLFFVEDLLEKMSNYEKK